MSFIRKTIDTANNQIQFEVSESCQSLNLKFNPEFAPYVNDVKIRLTKISRNAPNQDLYSGVFEDLKDLFRSFFPNYPSVLPFSIGKNLLLSEDDKILVTIDYTPQTDVNGVIPATVPTSFEYELNKFFVDTNSPLVIKKVVVSEQMDLDTEFYPTLLIPSDAESFETIVMQREVGKPATNKKVFYGMDLISSNIPSGEDYMAIAVSVNQVVTLKGNCTCYLVLA